jgi:hypothetical protein
MKPDEKQSADEVFARNVLRVIHGSRHTQLSVEEIIAGYNRMYPAVRGVNKKNLMRALTDHTKAGYLRKDITHLYHGIESIPDLPIYSVTVQGTQSLHKAKPK